MRVAVVTPAGQDTQVVAVVEDGLVPLAPLVPALPHPAGALAGVLSAVLALPPEAVPALAQRVGEVDPVMLVPTGEVRWEAPYVWGATVLCQVVNYLEHGAEASITPPSKPFLFYKPASSVVGPYDPVLVHEASQRTDFECELAAVIGRPGRDIPAERAYEHVAGYLVVNDVSYRDLQFNEGHPGLNTAFGRNWTKGKGLDHGCVMGPWITLVDQVPDPYALRLRTWVDDELRQDAGTGESLFRLPALIEEASRGATLHTGAVIATGTPAGVALGDGRWLQPGQVVTCEVEGLGALRSPVVRAAAAGTP